MRKLMLLAAVGIGYVLGARAGRMRYERIKDAATGVWQNPKVQQAVDTVESQAKQAANQAGSKISDVAADAGSKVRDKMTSDDEAPINPSDRLGDEMVGPSPVPGGSVFEHPSSGR